MVATETCTAIRSSSGKQANNNNKPRMPLRKEDFIVKVVIPYWLRYPFFYTHTHTHIHKEIIVSYTEKKAVNRHCL